MIIKPNDYFPSLKKIFAFRPKQCHECKTFYRYEILWQAETLPKKVDEKKRNIYTKYFLCLGCALERSKAANYFKVLTKQLADQM